MVNRLPWGLFAKAIKELKDKRGSDEWNEWFLRYVPEINA